MKTLPSSILITLFVLILGFSSVLIINVKAQPRTITVPDDYSTIQEAINIANIEDTIIVKNGTYHEHIVINKTITLQTYEKATINATTNQELDITPESARWVGVTITANNVTLSGFTIVDGVNHGIEVLSNNNIIFNNTIQRSTISGIVIKGEDTNHPEIPKNNPNNNMIFNNTVKNNERGITIVGSHHNLVEYNTVELNHECME